MTHLVPLGDTGWSVWRDALLRSAGFPADGLDRFAAPECAAAADRHLAGQVDDAAFPAAYADATRAASAAVCGIAADPLFREAVTWQNPDVLVALDGLVRDGPDGPRNVRRRGRENVVAGYWQRYVAKCETIGFFGPVCWGVVAPGPAAVTARPGPGLLRRRVVHLEHWALSAYADRLVADPLLRSWLAPRLAPHAHLDGRVVHRPAQRPAPVSLTESIALARCDGRRPAREIVDDLVRDEQTGVRRPEEGFLLLTHLAERGLLRWDFDLPPGFAAEAGLRARIDAVGDPGAREPARAGLDRLAAARDRVADAAGDPAALAAALADLDTEFTGLTGRSPRRRAGQNYAGRALCHEETVRDVEFTVGRDLLDALAPALDLPLRAARWLTAELATAYGDALRDLHDDLSGDGPVRLGDLWFVAQGPLFGPGDRPADRVAREFAARWERVLRLADLPAGTARLTVDAAELAPRVAAEFPATRPGWSAGRVHSPDLQLVAESPDAEVVAVLGELHAAYATFNAELFTHCHPDLARLRRAYAADLGPARLRPVYPVDFPRVGGRLSASLFGPDDHRLAFADAPGAGRERLVPANAAVVSEVAGVLVATGPDGTRWPLVEVFSDLIAVHAGDAFKLITERPHSPRVTVDRLVLARETWRTTVGATGLTDAVDPARRYLAVRRWRAALGLPERVFVRVATELKPEYVDLTSPLYANRLCLMLRAARRAGGADVPVTVTELLPTPAQAWLPDGRGRHYVSELRLHIRDAAEPEVMP
ncbi:lantibiotic dehydratase family protein [Micromonospora sp. NBC_01392]|uniref:lantibiotic dehydratase n=1 Tax=Micromonospora sp. NBC_01392 TaxID=2903588 RepID=UPI0032473E20